MFNYKLTIQYDGTDYSGWQIQQNAVTVQGVIASKLETLTKQKINLLGAGRTDSGVHAMGQVANFSCTEELDVYRFLYSLNSMLPFDIAVKEMKQVPLEFHSRFKAVSRTYYYIISKSKSPFFKKYSYLIHSKIDVEKLNKLSLSFIGKKDFQVFAREMPDNGKTECEIKSARWKDYGDKIIFRIEADRFLHSMVRMITGTLLRFEKENLPAELLAQMIAEKDKKLLGATAPAQGLFLVKVKYGVNN